MRIKSTAVQIARLAVLTGAALLPAAPLLAKNLPFFEQTANGTWDCRDPAGTFTGTVVLAEETYAYLKTDGTLGGYGKLRLLDADTHMPNFAVITGTLKDDFGSGAVGLTGPREDYEDISGELFLIIAVSADRNQSWYCTGRHAPEGLV